MPICSLILNGVLYLFGYITFCQLLFNGRCC